MEEDSINNFIMTPYEFLHLKGFKKTQKPYKRYNITIGELIDFLKEYSSIESYRDVRIKTQSQPVTLEQWK